MATYENWMNRRKGKQTGDVMFKLDTKNKTPEQNIVEIIQGLYVKKINKNDISPTNKTGPSEIRLGLRGVQKSSSDSRRLSYLNALITLLGKEDRSDLGFTVEEVMTCIRMSLVDESMVIRATALRVLRYLIRTKSDVVTFNTLKLPYLVIRSMDLMIRNEEERAQALRVVRRVIGVAGAGERRAALEPGLLRCLAAVARAGSAGDPVGDRLARPAVATLAEICVLNPELFIKCGGVAAVTRQLAECANPRMAEALCGVLLHTLNEPAAREAARLDLGSLAHPYCDFHVRPAPTDTSRDEREMRFTCSRLALLCVLRSWPGLLHFCRPWGKGGLKAIVAALALPRLEVRKAILDLLYELVGLPQPEWTDEISVALNAVDPSDFQDSWRLNEGFVAAEGTAILPHLSATGPDITEIHLALLLQCFLEAGLLDGLAEVIVTSDTFISVRATVLLGQLLHLIHLFLPPPICSVTPALPSLMAQASAGKPQALAAVAALRRLHCMLEARPASHSLFLDHIIQYCSGAFREREEDTSKSRKEKDNANMAKPKDSSLYKESSIEFLNESDNESEPKQRHSVGSRADVASRNVSALVKSKSVSSRTSAAVSKVTKSAKFFNLFERDSDNLIRCTLVMQNKDGNTWNWEIIRTILKETDGPPLLNLNDSGHKAWVARIISYLKPSANKYSHTDLAAPFHGHSATRAGCQLIRRLLRHFDGECQRLLEELFTDVSRQIEAIETGKRAHECLFSPQHMCNTMCQMYFLFIGQLCHSQNGLRLFKQTGLYDNLLELSTKTHHSCYVKLVISSLDYTLDSYPRDILAKTLTCNIQASRQYATQFLNVLLRASRKSRELVRRKSKLKKNFVLEHMKSHRDEIDSEGVDMDTWILQMLVGQVKDESKEVVKCALAILEEAHSVPMFVEKMMTMKETFCQNCRLDKNVEPASLDLAAVGDRGYLIWLSLEVASIAQTADSKSIAFLKKHLDFWAKSYNYRYVRLTDAGVHEALTLSGATRGAARARRVARVPPHILATLARHPAPFARSLLAAALPHHYKVLQREKCTTEQEIVDLKASLWAVGNAAVSGYGLTQLMNQSSGYLEDSVPLHIVRLAKFCPVYAVRATAFYVLGLIGSTYEGANVLSDMGWLCVRHTRHDQFPVIPEETFLSYDANVHNYISSPDRRVTAFDTEPSDHSDHTDSVADSLQSDISRQAKVTAGVEQEHKEQDVVDHKMNVSMEGRKEPDKRKSHTLPTQDKEGTDKICRASRDSGGKDPTAESTTASPAFRPNLGCSTSLDRSALTESRTVDILRDCSYERPPHARPENRLAVGRMNSFDHAHEGRVRNTSESSTSGVSSCDSFLGKYALPDRVLTLSPIPSSSSLYGMKSSSSSHRPRISDLQRRTSTSSFTTPDVASSPPSQLDMTGYATLKSLNKHRRPHVSESAATGSSELDDISWLLADSNRRSSKPFSSLREKAKTTKDRMTKMSLLDYDWKPLSSGDSERQSPPAPRVPRRPPPPPDSPAPSYMGICLPRDIMDLFPKDEEFKKSVEADKTLAQRNRVPSVLVDCSSASDKARATPDSQRLGAFRGGDMVRSAALCVAAFSGAGSSTVSSRIAAATRGLTNISITSNVGPSSIAGFKANEGSDTLIAGIAKAKITGSVTSVKDATSSASSATSKVSATVSISAETNVADMKVTINEDVPLETNATHETIVEGDEIDGSLAQKPTKTTDTVATSKTSSAVSSNISTTASEAGMSTSTVASGKVNASTGEGGAKSSDAGTASTGAVKTATVTAPVSSIAASDLGNTAVASRVEKWQHSAVDCLACVPTRPPSSHELREAFFAGLDVSQEIRVTSSPVPENSPQAEVLHNVFFMANPIHLRQTRSALLAIKQRHPEVFRSPCVYSDVCALLSRDTYMLCARRFLQELFLDTNFDCFASEPAAILARHPMPTLSTQ